MMCKDCIHVEVCREYVTGLAIARGVKLNETELEQVLVCDDCEHCADRSRFVELSSEVFTIVLGKVSAGRIDSANILLKNSTAWTFDSSHIGKEIFFTREEAEQALKERESSEN